jgi:hypothetical protein
MLPQGIGPPGISNIPKISSRARNCSCLGVSLKTPSGWTLQILAWIEVATIVPSMKNSTAGFQLPILAGGISLAALTLWGSIAVRFRSPTNVDAAKL